MPQLLVRDVPVELVDELKRLAAKNGRSAEAEHRAILKQTLGAARDAFRERSAKSRAATGRLDIQTTELLREDRDGGWQ